MTTTTSKEPAKIAGMFDAIARHYDTLNHLLSAGLDKRWRARTVDALELTGAERMLDMCTGTADLAIAAATSPRGQAREVVGVDFSAKMLGHGLAKVRAAGLQDRVYLMRGDATRMPLPDAAFDVATVAFGIRNVLDPALACREFHRVLTPGGRLAVLEFGSPSLPGLRSAYLWYFRHVLPRIGRLVSRHGDAYSYLPASVAEFPSGDAFAAILREAGFASVRHRTFTFGVVYLYLARKSGSPDGRV
ncbi:MAG: bifunctional demethylmenaquinone methyltransferase/2-methoxy-6-polyprenyl-1,4-benzoquinol methylase UbiE [Acidobacteria bacterium]|nr:bifunctional demethylmenaquinone methyltransferase/2-methoxy-6-polyprenyl-1,4-benzoquinol methylase UbiE [Acidobacteriota bacterium]